MKRNGNGHRNGKSNGVIKRGWDLANDGILWKKVTEHSPNVFKKQANGFVAQLQAAVQPSDALQGVLLDRMAASYLRKQLLLEMEAATRLAEKVKSAGGSLSVTEVGEPTSVVTDFPVKSLLSSNVLKYEALLDQSFHRDLILLQKLKEMAPVSEPSEPSLLNSEPLIEDDGTL